MRCLQGWGAYTTFAAREAFYCWPFQRKCTSYRSLLSRGCSLIRTKILVGCALKFSCTRCSVVGDADWNTTCNMLPAGADCNAYGLHDTSVSMITARREPRQIATVPLIPY